MSQPFKFGFGGEDLELDTGEDDEHQEGNVSSPDEAQPPTSPPRLHNLDDMLSTLPSTISYNTLHLQGANDVRVASLARRELFDIRAQLMAEDGSPEGSSTAGLSTDDILPNIYEGGFKTWEGSVDLANYLEVYKENLTQFLSNQCTIIELGAGTAIPTLYLLFIHLLFTTAPQPQNHPRKTIILADFNPSVLQLATLPNILLNYALACVTNPPATGDIDVDASLLQSFRDYLKERNVHLEFISGSWGPEFASLASPSLASIHTSNGDCLILASETIYSPTSTMLFTQTLSHIMSRWEENGERSRALVAAKKVYFGVGGGVDQFLHAWRNIGAEGNIVWETEGRSSGVTRCIMDVRLRKGNRGYEA
ncbi:MAG: hypothetical protein Q9201_002373 [Fulgogasparrea decipioides]